MLTGTSDFDDFEMENIFGMLQCECERYLGTTPLYEKTKGLTVKEKSSVLFVINIYENNFTFSSP